MTTETAANVHNVAIDGTFDDAQALVKALFADTAFAKAHHLAAVNSINWVRIAAQVAYYIATCLRLDMKPVTFVVPTGNFGDVFAGYVAHKMGAPIARLIVATNSNDILTRAIDTGVYARGQVHATMSPAMDIQVASNFERLIFEAHNRDGAATRKLMAEFAKTGSLEFSHAAHTAVRKLFAAASVDEHETSATIASIYKATGRIIDPHTAVGLAAAERLTRPEETVVTLATAHPAKFPEAVMKATGLRPALPAAMKNILRSTERYATLPNDESRLKLFVAQI
jgi:threonine synthase